MDTLPKTPIKGVPLTIERMLQLLGIKEFKLSSNRKRTIEKILGQIVMRKLDYRP